MKKTSEKGERLRQVLLVLGMTQKQLAAEAGVSEKSLSNFMRQRQRLTPEVALTLETRHGVSRDWLETGKGKMLLEPNYTNERFGRLLTDIGKLLTDYSPENLSFEDLQGASQRILEVVISPRGPRRAGGENRPSDGPGGSAGATVRPAGGS